MKLQSFFLITGLSLLPILGLSAQEVSLLSNGEVDQAIQQGSQGRRHIGLTLNDAQTAFLSAMACTTCAQSGYTIHIYTPEQWIEQMAYNAKHEMLPFSTQDVTPEMREQMLHVVAMPSTPEYLSGNGFSLSSSVHRIVLTDMTRQVVIQPVQLSNGSVTSNSAFRSAEFSTAHAAFMMSDVNKLRASAHNGEFFIAVTGERQNKFFRVKTRFFKSLFGENTRVTPPLE